jgi:hypothetical protein
MRITALSAMMLLIFTSTYGQDSPQVASVEKSISDIRQVDFKNFTYRLESAKEKEVFRLSAGRQVSADGRSLVSRELHTAI